MNKYRINILILLSLSLFTLNSLAAISCTSSISDYPYNTNQEPIAEKVQSNGRVYFILPPMLTVKKKIFFNQG